MRNYRKKNWVIEIPYRQYEKIYDLYYERILKEEENSKFFEKYYRLNEKIKTEEEFNY